MDKILEDLDSEVPSTTEADANDLDTRLDHSNSMANKYFEMVSYVCMQYVSFICIQSFKNV